MRTIKQTIFISLLWMFSIGVNCEDIPNNEIWYTSFMAIYVDSNTDFGANIINHTFKNNKGVITFDGDVTNIGGGTFYGPLLISVEIPNSVTNIGSSAFSECSLLSSINIPNSVTSIGSSAFSGCSSLSSINIPNSVTSIGSSAFERCLSLRSINIPERIKNIERFTFSECTQLISVEIPNSVTSIGDYAFQGCHSLTSINIPNSVTSIGSSAFGYCMDLSSVYLYWSQPLSVELDVFSGSLIYNATLYVPSGTKSKYQSAEVWKNFGEIIEQPIYITKISLNKTSTEMFVGDKLTLSANITPDNATNPNIEWVSSDNSIASVSNGIVTAIGPGICSIKAKTTDGSALEVSCSIMVSKQTQSITWNQDLSTLASGGQLVELKATSSSGLHISYKSSDDNVATIFDMGFASYLSPRNVGTATITARQEGNNYYAPVEMKKVANVVQFDNVNGVNAVNGRYTVYTATGTRIGTYNESEFRKLIDSHKLSGGLYIINGEKTIIK